MAHRHDFSGGLIVSCQAPESSPLRDPYAMALMALAAQKAGAVGIRAEGAADIEAIKRVCSLPVIGIRKHRYPDSDVYITATRHDVDIVADAGAEIVALDATSRLRPRGETLAEVIAYAKTRGLTVMADLTSPNEAADALTFGADYLATTLIGPSSEDIRTDGPNVAALRRIVVENPGAIVVAEGRYATPGDIAAAFEAGAKSVVVGRAITDAYALAVTLVDVTPRARE